MALPDFDQDRFSEGLEDLAVQKLVMHRAVETFAVAISPCAVWRDVKYLYIDPSWQLLDAIGDKFRTIAHEESSI